MPWWKILGLAAFASVAASGIVITRDQRRRRAYTPEEIRARLHARLAEASATPPAAPGHNTATRESRPHTQRQKRTLTPGTAMNIQVGRQRVGR